MLLPGQTRNTPHRRYREPRDLMGPAWTLPTFKDGASSEVSLSRDDGRTIALAFVSISQRKLLKHN